MSDPIASFDELVESILSEIEEIETLLPSVFLAEKPAEKQLEQVRQWYTALHPTFCEALRVSGFPDEVVGVGK